MKKINQLTVNQIIEYIDAHQDNNVTIIAQYLEITKEDAYDLIVEWACDIAFIEDYINKLKNKYLP